VRVGVLPAGIREITANTTARLGEVVAGLSDADLVAPTGCAGWLASHLLVHVRLGMAEHAAAFTGPAGDWRADRDYVSYWRDSKPSGEPVTFTGVRFHWANAAAYGSADMVRRHFADTAALAASASRHAPAGRFRFQGHVMEAEDILAIWAVEYVLHQFDLAAGVTGVPDPAPEALGLVTLTLDGLLGSRPGSWDEITYALKGTGRRPLDDNDRESLGARAAEYPAFG
jgi:uncharacterized protein (TIGR03083 family)